MLGTAESGGARWMEICREAWRSARHPNFRSPPRRGTTLADAPTVQRDTRLQDNYSVHTRWTEDNVATMAVHTPKSNTRLNTPR